VDEALPVIELAWMLSVVALSAEAAERTFLNFYGCTWLSHIELCRAYAAYTAMSDGENNEIVSTAAPDAEYRGK
jgi:hypothetical protein